MSVKKAKGKSKSTAKKATVKAETTKAKANAKAKAKATSIDIAEVREDINELVKDSATKIAASVIDVATRTGQLASAKYLFEAVGIYPVTEQMEMREIETTMAHQLLTRMGLPLEPVVSEDDSAMPRRSGEVDAPKKPAEVKRNAAGEGGEDNAFPADGE